MLTGACGRTLSRLLRRTPTLNADEPSGLRAIHAVRFFLSATALLYIAWNALHACQ